MPRRHAWPVALHALRHVNYRYFWVGALVSNIGTWMRTIALGWLVLDLTNSAMALGIVSFVQTIPILILSLPAGVVADRMSRQRILLITQAILLGLTLVLAVLVAGRWIQLWQVVAISLLMGLAMAFNGPAWQSFITDLVGTDDLMNAIALNSVQFNFSRIVGPALAGLLIAAVGLPICFFINTGTYVAVLAAVAVIRLPRLAVARQRLPLWRGIQEGLVYLRQDSEQRAIMLLTAALTIFGFPYAVLMPVVARDTLGLDATGYGQLMAATGVGALAGAMTMAMLGRRLRRGRIMGGAGLGFGLSLLAFALSPWLALSMVALAALGFSMIAYMTSANTMLQSRVPEPLRGRVMSIWTLTSFGLTPVGSLQAGAIASGYGAPLALGLGAVVCLAAMGAAAAFTPLMAAE